jgi:hypothetical protein
MEGNSTLVDEDEALADLAQDVVLGVESPLAIDVRALEPRRRRDYPACSARHGARA